MSANRLAALASIMGVLGLAGGALAADPANWACAIVAGDGGDRVECRECGPPQPEFEDLQICQVYDFTLGVDAHQSSDTELVVIVTPYLLQPAKSSKLLLPPDRLELRRAPAAASR